LNVREAMGPRNTPFSKSAVALSNFCGGSSTSAK
jgi:hypothetical protein